MKALMMVQLAQRLIVGRGQTNSHNVWLMIRAFIGLLFFVSMCQAQTIPWVDGFQLPLSDYTLNDGCLEWGGWGAGSYDGQKHLADDECSPAGTDVFAVTNGLVRFAHNQGSCPNNWGPLMIVESQTNNGNICVIYGHVVKDASISEGNSVVRGQKIGDIASGSGCWSDHIHFSVYQGAYGAATGVYPSWVRGYSLPANWPGQYINPVDFVVRGCFADGWHTDGISQAFLDKYNALSNQGHNLGSPWNNGPYGVFVHEQDGMYIQDFNGTSNNYVHPYTALVRKSGSNQSVCLVKEGFGPTGLVMQIG